MADQHATSERDKVVVITGAASGIGQALAWRYARSGARLGLLDMDEAGLQKLRSDLETQGGEALAMNCEVTRQQDCQDAIHAVIERYGGIDILINNAGITHLSQFADTDAEVVRKVMDVNFFGAVHCTKAAVDALIVRRGLVVTISSVAGFSPLAGRCAYSASKHALHGLFGTLRSEQQKNGVGVMIVCPGFTRTAIEGSALGGSLGAAPAHRTVFGRSADPDQVADAIYRAARRRQRLLVLSPVGKLALVMSRLCPGLYERMMTRRMGI
jgi:NAD(P)-dependent dehydrogenase (short-subunit alcohol dehydrogenase family)